MKIIDEKLLSEFRQARECGWCRKPLRHPPEVHHVHSRGAGRLDVRFNLIALGGPWDCGCHALVHSSGDVTRFDLITIIAARESVSQDWITTEIHRLRRLDKDGKEPRP